MSLLACLLRQMDRKSIHEKVAHALRSKKDPVAAKVRRPRRRAELRMPSGEEDDYFDQLLHTQRSFLEDLAGQEEEAAAAGALRDDDDDGYDGYGDDCQFDDEFDSLP
jgi:hypothetical protein